MKNNLCSPSNIIKITKSRRMMSVACGTHGENRTAYRILLGKPEGKRSVGKPRRRWEDNIKIDFTEILRGHMDWIDLAQDRYQ
jgi:hypothetical protein